MLSRFKRDVIKDLVGQVTRNFANIGAFLATSTGMKGGWGRSNNANNSSLQDKALQQEEDELMPTSLVTPFMVPTVLPGGSAGAGGSGVSMLPAFTSSFSASKGPSAM
jgi:hypothetical protein|eukprot:8081-Heterococcus_DN1.PRE.3